MHYIKESHEASKRIWFNNVEVINKKNYKVKSEEGVKLYYVSKVNERCAVNICKMVSPDCELCSHEYTCTCVDFLLRMNISKHIHLVAQCLSEKKHSSVPETNFPESDNENISTNITLKSEHRENENENCNAAYEVNLLGNMASSSRNIDDFQCLKSKTESYALELLNQMKSCTEFDKEALLHTAKQLFSLKNIMISLKKHKHAKALISNYHVPFNKSVETQKPSCSTKKNNKSKNFKLRPCKPAWEEKNQFLQIHYEEDTETYETNFKKQNSSDQRSWKIEEVDGKQLKMLRVKMSGKMEGLSTVQDVAKDDDLPGEVLKFDVTNLEKYFDKESWHVIMEKIDQLKASWICNICKIFLLPIWFNVIAVNYGFTGQVQNTQTVKILMNRFVMRASKILDRELG